MAELIPSVFAAPRRALPISLPILLRAAIVGLILGSILTLTNQPDAIFGGAEIKTLPLVLVFLAPFIVVTISQILGIQLALRNSRKIATEDGVSESFAVTALSRGTRSDPCWWA